MWGLLSRNLFLSLLGKVFRPYPPTRLIAALRLDISGVSQAVDTYIYHCKIDPYFYGKSLLDLYGDGRQSCRVVRDRAATDFFWQLFPLTIACETDIYSGLLLPDKYLLFERSKKRYIRFNSQGNLRYIFLEKDFSDFSRKSVIYFFR